MKVGDLVKYTDWWAGGSSAAGAMGIVLETPSNSSRDLSEQNYIVFWLRGNHMTGPYECMGKLLEVVNECW